MDDVANDDKTSRPWLFKKGNPGGPGRPKGVSLKEYARDFLAKMTDEERDSFMDGLSKDVIWKMAEGNPANHTDLTSKGEAITFNVLKYGDDKPAIQSEDVSNPPA